jgi:hypothetical protein
VAAAWLERGGRTTAHAVLVTSWRRRRARGDLFSEALRGLKGAGRVGVGLGRQKEEEREKERGGLPGKKKEGAWIG